MHEQTCYWTCNNTTAYDNYYHESFFKDRLSNGFLYNNINKENVSISFDWYNVKNLMAKFKHSGTNGKFSENKEILSS